MVKFTTFLNFCPACGFQPVFIECGQYRLLIRHDPEIGYSEGNKANEIQRDKAERDIKQLSFGPSHEPDAPLQDLNGTKFGKIQKNVAGQSQKQGDRELDHRPDQGQSAESDRHADKRRPVL